MTLLIFYVIAYLGLGVFSAITSAFEFDEGSKFTGFCAGISGFCFCLLAILNAVEIGASIQ